MIRTTIVVEYLWIGFCFRRVAFAVVIPNISIPYRTALKHTQTHTLTYTHTLDMI